MLWICETCWIPGGEELPVGRILGDKVCAECGVRMIEAHAVRDGEWQQLKLIETCARAAHEVNRTYCLALGDASQPGWVDAPDWQKSSARNGVEGALRGATPEQSHESWCAEKVDNGWKYGTVKDPEKKEHPCLVPYKELPPEQRAKDDLFLVTVRSVASALGAPSAGDGI